MKSHTIQLYDTWLSKATPDQIEFVDSVYALCEANYARGGDMICECWCPSEITEEFTSVGEVKDYIGLQLENATNFREGTDEDPELRVLHRFEEEWEG